MRLEHPEIRRCGDLVAITFDDQPLLAVAGETVAAALAANGIACFRRSQQSGRRGLYCGMGACFECLLTIDGRASQRACLTKVADRQQIRSRMPTGQRFDPLAPLTPPPTRNAPEEQAVDLLVIGAGPAGLAAAKAAARRGTGVTVLDERPQSGGQFFKPLAPSHHAAAPTDRQFRAGLALVEATREAGAVIVQEATVWGAQAAGEVVAIVDGREIVSVGTQ